MKKILITAAVLLGLGVLGAGVGAWLLFGANTPTFEGERTVKIPPGAAYDTVLDSLDRAGIVGSRATLGMVGRLTGWGDQVKAGHYAFEAGASNVDLLQTLRRGLQTPVRLTIPPGSRPEVVAAVAAREMYFDADAFRDALTDPDLAAELGTDTLHLFGYMLPETYFFYWLAPPETVVRTIKEEFDERYMPELAEHGAELGLTMDEVVRLASIVEWETDHVPEKARVAGVYLNRLQTPGWRLQADPTVQYGLLEIEGQKRRLFRVDYQLEHPYNTYRIDGLPPGPITNPSPTSVQSVFDAEDHRYFYFVAQGDGTHAFSRTLAEHNRAAERYFRLMRQRRAEAAADNGS